MEGSEEKESKRIGKGEEEGKRERKSREGRIRKKSRPREKKGVDRKSEEREKRRPSFIFLAAPQGANIVNSRSERHIYITSSTAMAMAVSPHLSPAGRQHGGRSCVSRDLVIADMIFRPTRPMPSFSLRPRVSVCICLSVCLCICDDGSLCDIGS